MLYIFWNLATVYPVINFCVACSASCILKCGNFSWGNPDAEYHLGPLVEGAKKVSCKLRRDGPRSYRHVDDSRFYSRTECNVGEGVADEIPERRRVAKDEIRNKVKPTMWLQQRAEDGVKTEPVGSWLPEQDDPVIDSSRWRRFGANEDSLSDTKGFEGCFELKHARVAGEIKFFSPSPHMYTYYTHTHIIESILATSQL